MSLPEEVAAGRAIRVGIGDFALGGPKNSYRVTLGSCVGVALVWSRQSRFAVAHVLLPSVRKSSMQSQGSRYADLVVPFLLEQLEVEGRNREITAFVAGGGQMYKQDSDGEQVGPLNVAALESALKDHRIRIEASDFGGTTPRQLVVDGPSRQVYSMHLDNPEGSLTWNLPRRFSTPESL